MPNRPLRVIVNAASGRMGSQVAALAAADARFVVAGCVFRAGGSRLESNAHRGLVLEPKDLAAQLAKADAVVDFSTPEASVAVAAAAARARKAAVIGTTGLSSAQKQAIKKCAKTAPLFLSPNFSFAVNLLFWLAGQAARRLPDYEAGIVEVHHSKKKDAPSGTALVLGEAVTRARRDGRAVPTASQRLGDVVGEHMLTLAGPFERLELSHKAHSRALFARGSLEAALWVAAKKPGVYDMQDLMDLR